MIVNGPFNSKQKRRLQSLPPAANATPLTVAPAVASSLYSLSVTAEPLQSRKVLTVQNSVSFPVSPPCCPQLRHHAISAITGISLLYQLSLF